MKREWLLIYLFVAVLAYTFGVHSGPAVAQQTFLPMAFQPGSKLTLNNDRAATYIVLSQQGAWIQVHRESEGQSAKPEGQTATEMWIYAPNGTLWTKVK
jgi:hypothetical protein